MKIKRKQEERDRTYNENFAMDDIATEKESRVPKARNIVGSGGLVLAKNEKPSFPPST